MTIARAIIPMCLISAAALAQPDPSGITFVTVGAPGNPAYRGEDPFGNVTGRGSVPYEYRIGQTEVTTAQWMEFYNAFKARPDFVDDNALPAPTFWGASIDPTYAGPGRRYRLSSAPNSDMRPAYQVTWRTAAMFCNWLHNDKSTDLSAIRNGAYDVTTFASLPDGTFTDQAAHHPGARYWIPTLDEWLKAAHYDPAKPDRDGWWLYPISRDTPPIYGRPGEGEANSAILGNFEELRIPLGAYPSIQSPWGGLDFAGGTIEWTEDIFRAGGEMYRIYDGSFAGQGASSAAQQDQVFNIGAQRPGSFASRSGFRIAAPVPGLPTVACLGVLVRLWIPRRR